MNNKQIGYKIPLKEHLTFIYMLSQIVELLKERKGNMWCGSNFRPTPTVGVGPKSQSERRTMANLLLEHTSGHVVTQNRTVTIVKYTKHSGVNQITRPLSFASTFFLFPLLKIVEFFMLRTDDIKCYLGFQVYVVCARICIVVETA